MSSTNRKAERAARDFFDEVLCPLGHKLRESGIVLADVGSSRTAHSFYEPVLPFGKKDFELATGGDPENLGASLLRQWRDEPALHPLAGKLAELAKKIGSEVEQSGEVSPFVYVMF